jgi:hypothetical protein
MAETVREEEDGRPPISALSFVPWDPLAPGDYPGSPSRITPRTAFCANTLFSFKK